MNFFLPLSLVLVPGDNEINTHKRRNKKKCDGMAKSILLLQSGFFAKDSLKGEVKTGCKTCLGLFLDFLSPVYMENPEHGM